MNTIININITEDDLTARNFLLPFLSSACNALKPRLSKCSARLRNHRPLSGMMCRWVKRYHALLLSSFLHAFRQWFRVHHKSTEQRHMSRATFFTWFGCATQYRNSSGRAHYFRFRFFRTSCKLTSVHVFPTFCF